MGYSDLMEKVERWINILNSMGASSSSNETIGIAASATTTEGILDSLSSSSSSSSEESDEQDTYAERLVENPKITQSTIRCAVCEGHHLTERCGVLAKMEPDGKVKKLAEKKLCFQCLAPGHGARDCRREKPFCIICHKPHQTILHGRTYPNSTPRASENARSLRQVDDEQRRDHGQQPTNTATTLSDDAGNLPNPTDTETQSL